MLHDDRHKKRKEKSYPKLQAITPAACNDFFLQHTTVRSVYFGSHRLIKRNCSSKRRLFRMRSKLKWLHFDTKLRTETCL